MLYKHIYINLQEEFQKADNLLSEYKFDISIYQQIFSNDAEGYATQGFLNDSLIPPSDLEIVLSAIRMDCDLFLLCDKKLIKNIDSFGASKRPAFLLFDSEPQWDDFATKIIEFKKSLDA